MQRVILKLRQRPYANALFLALGLVVLALWSDGSLPAQLALPAFDFQVVTGLLLLLCLMVQWILFGKRLLRSARNMRQHVVLHRWSGVAATLLFSAHAIRMGHVWMTMLSVTFFLVAVTGVLNREVMGYRSNVLYLMWLACHIGLSAVMMPLIAVHIWVALAYQ